MIGRRRFLTASSAFLLAAPLAAETQQAAKVHRIGYLSSGPRSSGSHPLIPQLRTLGWVDGQNLEIERRYDEGQRNRLPSLAAQLIDLKVSVIIAVGTPAALAAKGASATIPIVMVLVADPVRSGLVVSLARPGGNVTGMSIAGPEIAQKFLALLKDVAPRTSAVGLLFDPANPSHDVINQLVSAAATALHIRTHQVPADASASLDAVFEEALRKQVDALLVHPLGRPVGFLKELAGLAIKHRLPSLYPFREFAEQGGLMTFTPSSEEQFQRAAVYVNRIFRGAKPADLPVETPTKFTLVINVRTAQDLGLTIPSSLLQRADQVIE